MKCNIICLIATLILGYVTDALASRAMYPYALDRDLQEMARSVDYDQIVEIKITGLNASGNEEARRCSAVRANNVLLTAAHCFPKNTKDILIFDSDGHISQENVTAYFKHPGYTDTRSNDLAVLYTTESTQGYSIDGSLDAESEYVGVGFGPTNKNQRTIVKKAFDVCGSLRLDSDTNVINQELNEDQEYPVSKKCGIVTSGDSGGALLKRSETGMQDLVGITIWESGLSGSWRMLDDHFVKLIEEVRKDIRGASAINNQISVQDLTSVAQNKLLANFDFNRAQMIAAETPIAFMLRAEKFRDKGKVEQGINWANLVSKEYGSGYRCNIAIMKKEPLSDEEFDNCVKFVSLPNLEIPISLMPTYLENAQFLFYYKIVHGLGRLGEIMGNLAERGKGETNQRKLIAEKALKAAAYKGHSKAVFEYLSKNDVDSQQLVNLYEKAAKRADEAAQYYLAIILMPDSYYDQLNGNLDNRGYKEQNLREKTQSIEKDCELSMQWLKAAVDSGHSSAELALALLMNQGLDSCEPVSAVSVGKDHGFQEEAFKLLKKAADNPENSSKLAKDMICSILLSENGEDVTEYCMEDIPVYILADPSGMANKMAILKGIFSNIQNKNYLPSGKSLEKLTKIQEMFQKAVDRAPEYYKEKFGAEAFRSFYETELPKLIEAPSDQDEL